MPAEEHKEMHASQAHGMDGKMANQNSGAYVYPLETIMALQKALEGGIPEQATHTNHEPHPPLQTSPTARQPRPATAHRFYNRLAARARDWGHRLQLLFTRDKRSNKTGRGSSARQTG